MTRSEPLVTLSWPVQAAIEVAHVLHGAAINKQGRVWDHGFEEDAQSIWRQVEAIEARQTDE